MPLAKLTMLACVLAGPALAQDDGQSQMDFANGLFQRGFVEEAAKEYRGYVEAHPKGEHVSVALYRLGEAEYASKHYEEAAKAFDRFLQAAPAENLVPRAQVRKGEILYRLKKVDEAIEVLKPLTVSGVVAEARVPALYYLGKACHDAGQPGAAQTALRELAREYPDHALAPYARYQLAYVFLALNDLENAAVEFSTVAESKADATLRMESRFRAAETYDKLKWYDPALKAYQQLRDEFPDSDYAKKATYGYTWALYHAGKFADAAKAAGEYAKANDDPARVPGLRFLQANCLQQEKQYEPAVALYREIVQKYPESEFAAKAQYKVLWALYLAGKTAEAKTEAATFLAANPDPALAADAAFLLGSIAYAEKDYATAVTQYLTVAHGASKSEFAPEALFKAAECQAQLGQTAEAAKTFEAFAAAYPDNALTPQAMLRAGDAQFLTSTFEGAVEKYKKLLETPLDPATEEDVLYRLALAYHNIQNYEASAAAFGRLLEKHPQTPHAAEAHLRTGDFLLENGKDPVKAMAEYEAAQAADPKGEYAGRALKGVALARYESKDYDGAAAMFLRVIAEYPDMSMGEKSYAWVGQRLFDQEKWSEATVAFEALLKHSPDYPDAEAVRLKMAQAQEASGKPEEAAKLYKPLVNSNDRTVATEAKLRLAKILEETKEGDAAAKLYEELASANTGDAAAQAQFHLGELEEAKGEYEAAATRFMRVAILFLHEDLTPECLWRAGQCFEKAGTAPQARKAYGELLSDYPDAPQTAKAKERLAELGA